MHGEAEVLARAIGARVKHQRKARGLTLDRLAEAAGVSKRMVINVEQGAVNPSVGTLLRISDALGVGLPALVQPPQPTMRLTRQGEGAVLWSGEHGGKGVLVAGTEPPEVVELWDWTLGAADRHRSEAHSDGTHELLHVIEGTVTVQVGGETFELGTGDALSFFSDVEHSYSNPGDTPARFALTVYQPAVGRSTPGTGTNRQRLGEMP